MHRRTEVKPFIDLEKREILYKLKFITNRSINGIAEDLCLLAIEKGIVEELSPHFQRNVEIKGVFYEVSMRPVPLPKQSKRKSQRISLYLDDSIYEVVYGLSYTLGLSVAKVVTLILEKTLFENSEILISYIHDFILEKFNKKEINDLLLVIESITNEYWDGNQELDQEKMLASFIFFIFNEFKNEDESMEEAVLRMVSSWV